MNSYKENRLAYRLPRLQYDHTQNSEMFFFATKSFKEVGKLSRVLVERLHQNNLPRKVRYGFEIVLFNICCCAIFKEIYGLDVPVALSIRNGSTFSKICGYKNLKMIIDWLKSEDLITISLGFKCAGRVSGISSKLRPTETFLELLQPFLLEPVRVEKEMVVIKNPDKKNPLNLRGFKREITRTHRVLKSLNSLISSANIKIEKTINIQQPQAVMEYLVNGTKPRKGKSTAIQVKLNPQILSYNRVYSNHLGKGGRLLGGIQSLPKQERFTTTINDSETCELDFSSLHPNLCYALVGEQPPSDCYAITSVPRPIAKALMVTALNAKSRQSAIKSVRWELMQDKKSYDYDFEKAYDELEILHKPIIDCFYSSAWEGLQHTESCIMLEIIAHFTDKGIICFGIHDSAIVEIKYQEELHKVMCSKFKEVTNASFAPRVDRKDS